MKIRIILFGTLLFWSFSAFSQDPVKDTPEFEPASKQENDFKKNGLSFNIAGTSPALGISYDRAITGKSIFEIGMGLPSIGIGYKRFPAGL